MSDDIKKLLDSIVENTNKVLKPTSVEQPKQEETPKEGQVTNTVTKLPSLEELLGKRS